MKSVKNKRKWANLSRVTTKNIKGAYIPPNPV